MGKMYLDKFLEPDWATLPGRIVEPPAGRKETGWEENDRPSAKQLNWLFSESFKAYRAAQISNFYRVSQGGDMPDSTPLISYAPSKNLWVSSHSDSGGLNLQLSTGLYNWYAFLTISSVTGQARATGQIGAEDLPKYAVLSADGKLIHTALRTSNPQYELFNVNITNPLYMATNYPAADLNSGIVLVANSTEVEYSVVTDWATSGGVVFTAPSVPPAIQSGDTIISLIHITGSTFILGTVEGRYYRTENNGDTWATVADLSFTGAVFTGLDYSPDSDVLTAAYRDSNDILQLVYSEDKGSSWQYHSPNILNTQSSSASAALRYAGNNIWVAYGQLASTGGLAAKISYDNCYSWSPLYTSDIGSIPKLAVSDSHIIMYSYGLSLPRAFDIIGGGYFHVI